jgi:hypothetical protein
MASGCSPIGLSESPLGYEIVRNDAQRIGPLGRLASRLLRVNNEAGGPFVVGHREGAMRRFLACCGAAIVGLLVGGPCALAQLHHHRSPSGGAPAPTVHHLSLHNHSPHNLSPHNTARPVGAASGISSPSSAVSSFDRSWRNRSTIFLYWGSGYPLIWSGAYTPAFVPYYYPVFPYFEPMIDEPAAAAPLARNVDAVNRPANDPLIEPPLKPKGKVSTAEQKARAGKSMGQGDANFAKQQYPAAAERYRSAAQYAPDLAEPHFRQAHALVAIGQYANAAKAFRRGLKIRSDWSGSPFRLDQIYGDGVIAKVNHFENLAKAVEANPLDSSLLLALGMQLFFDGQRDRAEVFFTRAAQLGGNEDRLLDDFLARHAPADAPAARKQDAAKIVF